MVKLVIDTDPGVDDAMAILFAARHPEIELLGMTSVFGNVTVGQATRNALYLAEKAGIAHLPVAEGAAGPMALPPFPPSKQVHGDEGFGDLPAFAPKGRAIGESAAAFLVRLAREHAGELVLCPVGPITNIADAIKLDPDFARNVKKIVIMGGALDVAGNITPHAEANTYHDPHALDLVLQSGADITMVGLDVTLKVLLAEPDFAELAERAPKNGRFLQDISHFYLDFYHSVGLSGCGLHDPMAVIACIAPELFTAEETGLAVALSGEEIGKTFRDPARPKVKVLTRCDAEAIRALFFDILDERAPVMAEA